jgi:hypothetical protein
VWPFHSFHALCSEPEVECIFFFSILISCFPMFVCFIANVGDCVRQCGFGKVERARGIPCALVAPDICPFGWTGNGGSVGIEA